MTLTHSGIVIRAYGRPITQGSKIRTRFGLVDDNTKTLKPWRQTVKLAAIDAARYHDKITGPVFVRVTFSLDRPASHYRTGANAHLLRDKAPAYPIARGSGDVDKFQRAAFDALTDAGVWGDDVQVVDVRARKVWAGEHDHALDRPGVRIDVIPLDTAGRQSMDRAASHNSTTLHGHFADQPWADRALCAQTDPEAFFPEKGGSTREAKQVCNGNPDKDIPPYPVRAECLDWALTTEQRFGIFGGTSERERRKLAKEQPAALDQDPPVLAATGTDAPAPRSYGTYISGTTHRPLPTTPEPAVQAAAAPPRAHRPRLVQAHRPRAHHQAGRRGEGAGSRCRWCRTARPATSSTTSARACRAAPRAVPRTRDDDRTPCRPPNRPRRVSRASPRPGVAHPGRHRPAASRQGSAVAGPSTHREKNPEAAQETRPAAASAPGHRARRLIDQLAQLRATTTTELARIENALEHIRQQLLPDPSTRRPERHVLSGKGRGADRVLDDHDVATRYRAGQTPAASPPDYGVGTTAMLHRPRPRRRTTPQARERLPHGRRRPDQGPPTPRARPLLPPGRGELGVGVKSPPLRPRPRRHPPPRRPHDHSGGRNRASQADGPELVDPRRAGSTSTSKLSTETRSADRIDIGQEVRKTDLPRHNIALRPRQSGHNSAGSRRPQRTRIAAPASTQLADLKQCRALDQGLAGDPPRRRPRPARTPVDAPPHQDDQTGAPRMTDNTAKILAKGCKSTGDHRGPRPPPLRQPRHEAHGHRRTPALRPPHEEGRQAGRRPRDPRHRTRHRRRTHRRADRRARPHHPGRPVPQPQAQRGRRRQRAALRGRARANGEGRPRPGPGPVRRPRGPRRRGRRRRPGRRGARTRTRTTRATRRTTRTPTSTPPSHAAATRAAANPPAPPSTRPTTNRCSRESRSPSASPGPGPSSTSGKDVENRTRNIAGAYRGPGRNPRRPTRPRRTKLATAPGRPPERVPTWLALRRSSASSTSSTCTRRWATGPATTSGSPAHSPWPSAPRRPRRTAHLESSNPRPRLQPIPYRGAPRPLDTTPRSSSSSEPAMTG